MGERGGGDGGGTRYENVTYEVYRLSGTHRDGFGLGFCCFSVEVKLG